MSPITHLLWKGLKWLGGATAVFLTSKVLMCLYWLPTYIRYRRAGIPFVNGWNYFADALMIKDVIEAEPTGFNLTKRLKQKLGTDQLPPIVGICFLGMPYLHITTCQPLQDLFVNKNSHITKHPASTDQFKFLMNQSMFLAETNSPTFTPKRKELSSAFFKSKLIEMTKVIKKCTLQEIKAL